MGNREQQGKKIKKKKREGNTRVLRLFICESVVGIYILFLHM